MSANDKCPAHYANEGEQHWDRCWRLYGRGYFVASATKYVERYHKKNGLDDLKKAIHFLEKLCELEKAAADGTGSLGAEGAQPLVLVGEMVGIKSLRPYDQPTTEGSKNRWLNMLAANHVKVRTPHENVHGYVVREGVLWCPHCGCPHDSFDPFEKGLTCAQCKRSLTTFEEECGLCNGEGVVTCEWDSAPTPCPKCQASYEG